MNKEQRNKVTRDQIERFFVSYFPSWRLQQILTIEKLLQEKFSFYPSIISDTKQSDDLTGDSTIAQEITHGLLFEAISNCVQYIEDLFALLKAGENKDFFIKNIITYDAGKIENFIKQPCSEEKMCKLFYFPLFKEEFDNKEVYAAYTSSISQLHSWISELKEFHSKHQFFYKQYKHGLTVALRPYGLYNDEQIQKAKDNDFNPYLAAFDNLALNKLKYKKDRLDGYVFMPCFTDNVRPHIPELMKEDNLVRYIFPPRETNIEKIKDIAFKVRESLNIFTNNIIQTVREENPYKMQMPSVEKGKVFQFSFDVLTENANDKKNVYIFCRRWCS